MIKTFLAAVAFAAATLPAIAQETYDIGSIVEDFTLQNVDGSEISLSDYSDQEGLIVIFSCNTCPYVKAYEDRMIALHNKYSELGYPVVAINPNDKDRSPADSYEHMQQRAREKGFTFPYLYDADQAVADRFGAMKTPHVYLLANNEGSFAVTYIGAIDDSPQTADTVEKRYLEEAITALMDDRKPDPEKTIAIGCTIKRPK